MYGLVSLITALDSRFLMGRWIVQAMKVVCSHVKWSGWPKQVHIEQSETGLFEVASPSRPSELALALSQSAKFSGGIFDSSVRVGVLCLNDCLISR